MCVALSSVHRSMLACVHTVQYVCVCVCAMRIVCICTCILIGGSLRD